jgi:hypothetical protein
MNASLKNNLKLGLRNLIEERKRGINFRRNILSQKKRD